ncbi:MULTISPECIES: lipopolysaccharide biosynthesis protein [unclassified Microbacterium]|uniref:lipopolysaccharide biosynthesis protein n=1 Tax=unclassified Microbacterium TaxID=2609290 RepID=UPI003015E3D7
MSSESRGQVALKGPARHLTGYAIAKVLPGVIGMITVPLWIKTFGQAPYAMYSIVWVIGNFGGAITIGWLRQAILRFSGDAERSSDGVSRYAIAASILAGVIPLAVTVMWVGQQDPNLPWIIVTGVVFSILNSLYLVQQAHAQSGARVTAYSSAEIVRAAVALGASLLAFALWRLDPVICMIGGYALSTLIALLVLKRRRPQTTDATGPTTVVFWRYGWPMSIWLALSLVLVYFDRLWLAPTVSADQLGLYAATGDLIIRGMGMVAFPLTMYVHPLIMKHWNAGERAEALRLNLRFLVAVAIITGACVAGLAVVSTWALSLLLDGVAPSPAVFLPLAIGAALWQIALQAHKPLEMMNRTGTMTAMLLCVCALTIGALTVFVPLYQTRAAATIFACGAALYVAASIWLGQRATTRMRRESHAD